VAVKVLDLVGAGFNGTVSTVADETATMVTSLGHPSATMVTGAHAPEGGGRGGETMTSHHAIAATAASGLSLGSKFTAHMTTCTARHVEARNLELQLEVDCDEEEAGGLPPSRSSSLSRRGTTSGRLEGLNLKQFQAEMRVLCGVSSMLLLAPCFAGWHHADTPTPLLQVTHPHICSLFAFSVDGPQLCLVLELCTGGSLDRRLEVTAATSSKAPLRWQARVRIAAQVAQALVYLHSQSPPLLHRDVKSANVLLDGAGNAKIADFGTAYTGAPDGLTHKSTRIVAGTRGYMPPEYANTGHVSEKTDSYAFGIVLLELVTGKAPEDAILLHEDNEEEALGAAVAACRDKRAGEWPAGVVSGLAQAAEQCLKLYAKRRASVKEVQPLIETLEKLAQQQQA
jgi:serine/threonine protein kinase